MYQAQQQPSYVGQPTSHPYGPGILAATPVLYPYKATSLPTLFSTMTFQDPTWNMDTGATSHLISNARNLSTIFNKRLFPSIHVGDGNSIPVTNTGHSILSSIHRPLHLYNVLVTPNIIKNLISVRQFTRDNNCTIEFDTFGFFVNDFLTRHILLRCDSSGDLYPVTKPSTTPAAFLSTSASTWHQRLDHPGDEVLRSLVSRQFFISQWRNAMYDEYNALVKNDTWLLVPRPAGVNMVHSMWLFKHKFNADETLSRYKARLVANGSSQQLGVGFDETFSPVVKPATIRTVLSLAVSRKWPIHQLDVKNAFLNGDLSETVYMHQPPGFIDARFPNHVCRLQRSLYGLKQAPRAWFQRFAGYATRARFYHGRCDSSLFICRQGSQVSYLLIYVDDIILTVSSLVLLQQIIDSLHNEFDMTDLGALNYFHGISADRDSIESKLGPEGVPVQDPTLYRSLLYTSATTSLVGYTDDADWAGCPSIRSVVYMSANPFQHQQTKHIEIDIHFVCDMVTAGQVRVLHVPFRYQYADIFTEGLPLALF
ncbi:ribonuclease H-like domain-containing protein [Tanacetum coccineum]